MKSELNQLIKRINAIAFEFGLKDLKIHGNMTADEIVNHLTNHRNLMDRADRKLRELDKVIFDLREQDFINGA
jgi:hypothetical protein